MAEFNRDHSPVPAYREDYSRETIFTPIDTVYIGPDGSEAPVPTELVYDPTVPYGVTMVFYPSSPDDNKRWEFGRDLLDEGLDEPVEGYGSVGEGDVHVWNAPDCLGRTALLIMLSPPDGTALFQMDAKHVHQFIEQTEELVAFGEESKRLDIDTTIAAIFASEGE